MHKNRNPNICSIYSFPAPTSRFFSFEPTASLLPRRLYTFQPLTVSPPFTDKVEEHMFPLIPETPRVRPAAHRMTPEYLAKYKLAIQKMKELDTTDPDDPRGFAQQANVHCAYCNGPYDQVSFPTLDILPFQEVIPKGSILKLILPMFVYSQLIDTNFIFRPFTNSWIFFPLL